MSREKYQKIRDELLLEFQKEFNYEIIDGIQEIDLSFNLEKLRQEIFYFISKNGYGYKNVSLRLPESESYWDDQERVLKETAWATQATKERLIDWNIEPEKYVKWHPSLPTDSYLYELTNIVENTTGLKTFKISLRWMMPDEKFSLHSDPEPCRIHIPIITNNEVYYIMNGKTYNMLYGKAYHLLPPVEHSAINYGVIPRLHLIFSTYTTNDLINDRMKELAGIDILKEKVLSTVENNSGVDKNSLGHLFKINSDSPVEGRISKDIFETITKSLKGK